MTTKNQNTATFENLANVIIKESAKRIEDFKSGLNTEEDFNQWYYRNLLTARSAQPDYFKSVEDKRAYLMKRKEQAEQKRLQKELNRLETIYNAERAIDLIKISVEWKKSKTWGANPTAEIEVYYTGGGYDNFKSGSISGAGYDKESTAISEALNQCNALLNKLYTVKNQPENADKDNHSVLGYGSGYSITPIFEGGAGVSVYREIFEKIGMTFEKISSGKMYDVYTVRAK